MWTGRGPLSKFEDKLRIKRSLSPVKVEDGIDPSNLFQGKDSAVVSILQLQRESFLSIHFRLARRRSSGLSFRFHSDATTDATIRSIEPLIAAGMDRQGHFFRDKFLPGLEAKDPSSVEDGQTAGLLRKKQKTELKN
ncbi:hypothetical protein V6N11_033555 [Hibiscus sabdariffa]|uniref:Uncharacterized protein n=1 Tax=Hibiscus sabdariffa TaxID=183260 RepID=A0ABR2PYG1_9ROSI